MVDQSSVPVYRPLVCPDPINRDPRRSDAYCPPAPSRSEPLSHSEYLKKLTANGGRPLSNSNNTVTVGTGMYATKIWTTAGGDCDRGANLVLPAVPAVHASGRALDASLLSVIHQAQSGRGTVSKYDSTNRTEDLTTLRRQGLAIAAGAGVGKECGVCGLEGTTNVTPGVGCFAVE